MVPVEEETFHFNIFLIINEMKLLHVKLLKLR